jgi:hypothetical protein
MYVNKGSIFVTTSTSIGRDCGAVSRPWASFLVQFWAAKHSIALHQISPRAHSSSQAQFESISVSFFTQHSLATIHIPHIPDRPHRRRRLIQAPAFCIHIGIRAPFLSHLRPPSTDRPTYLPIRIQNAAAHSPQSTWPRSCVPPVFPSPVPEPEEERASAPAPAPACPTSAASASTNDAHYHQSSPAAPPLPLHQTPHGSAHQVRGPQHL